MNNPNEQNIDPAAAHARRVNKIRRQLYNITKSKNYLNIFLERYPSWNNSLSIYRIRNTMRGQSRNKHILDLYEGIIAMYPKEITDPEKSKKAA